MFGKLFIKEWKEKAPLFFFGLGILVLFLLAHLGLSGKRDLLEWLTYAVLLLFFPFMALILGSGGFETEFRNGAWAYLFSRPVNKTVIWLTKYASLLSMLAALWLAFLAMWYVFPKFSDLTGARVLLGFSVENGFPLWSLVQSGLFLTIAFSLSILYEKQFNILFLSLILGLGFTVAVWLALNSKVGGNLIWTAPSTAITTFLVSQILIALAFAAASLLTLVKSDFSQFRKKTLSFLQRAVPLVVLALVGTVAWALFSPLPGEHYLSFLASSGGEPYYITQQGVFKYSATKNRVQWLAKSKLVNFFLGSAASGKIAYTAFNIRSKNDVVEELWVVNSDGTSRRRVIGRGSGKSEWPSGMPIFDLMISPGGTKIMIFSQNAAKRRPGERSPFWIVNMDGTGLENLPVDPALVGVSPERFWLHFAAWAHDGDGVLMFQRSVIKPDTFRLWLYDLKSRAAKIFLENAVPVSPVSPRGDVLAVKYQARPGQPWRLALLDLKTLEKTEVPGGEDKVYSQTYWDPAGDHLAFFVRKVQEKGPDAYVLSLYSLTAKRIVAEKVMTDSEATARLYSPAWTADGARLLVLDRAANGLRVLGPDLNEEKRIAFPESLRVPVGLHIVGANALVEDDQTDTLWRLDLKTGSWKKIF
jgi:ABC-type transport system involved in multi-copper enzyme maturation permease subunit